MRYLITTKTNDPFLTNWFEPGMFNAEIGMVVYDLQAFRYTKNGMDWYGIKEGGL